MKIVIFTGVKNRCMLHGRVFVMMVSRAVVVKPPFKPIVVMLIDIVMIEFEILYMNCINANE